MILKEKVFLNPADARSRAGEEAEKQMAFYLQRAFRKNDDCFVINDLRVVHDGDAAQIDHLIVSVYGLFIVESKSVHGTISINEYADWQRTYGDEKMGMPSPVLQAQEQGRILKDLLRENAEKLLGKILFGKLQKGFKYCPVNVYVAISDNGIIERGMSVPQLYKADVVSGVISKYLSELEEKTNLLSPKNLMSSEVVWKISKNEAQATAEFLLAAHTPLAKLNKFNSSPIIREIAPQVENASDKTFVPKVGAACPVCREQKLVRKSISRSDGTETDFLACTGYPSECKAIFPLVAVVRNEVVQAQIADHEANNQMNSDRLCPRCGTGKLVRKSGKYGKPDFYGCSNYGKTKCGFTESIDK